MKKVKILARLDEKRYLALIPLEYLVVADYNPREAKNPDVFQAMIEDAKKNGIESPLLVRKVHEKLYEVFQGGTRFEALQKTGAEHAFCIIYEISREEAMDKASRVHFIEDPITPAEKGKFILRCIKEGIYKNVKDASKKLGFSRQIIHEWIRMARIEAVETETSKIKPINKEAKKKLASLPKPAREKIIETISSLDKNAMEKVRDKLHEIIEEAKKEGEDEPEEIVKAFQEKLIETFEEESEPKPIKWRGSSGYHWEIFEDQMNIVIFKYERETLIEQMKIPESQKENRKASPR